MKRSPWFNARTEPPVNGDAWALYEQRCKARRPVHAYSSVNELASVMWLRAMACDRCQWRGLLREDGGKA